VKTEIDHPHALTHSSSRDDNADLEALRRGFSCPQQGLDVAAFEMIAVEYARAVTSGFLERYGAALDQQGAGLRQCLADWSAGDILFSSAWTPVFGAMGDVLAGSSPITPIECGARLGLHLCNSGFRSDWSLTLPTPTNLRWGRWLLPAGRSIGVRWDGEAVAVEAGDGGLPLLFQRAGEDWSCDQPPACPEVKLAERPLIFLLQAALDAPELEFLHADLLDRSKWDEAPVKCEAAIGLMRSFSPQYLAWIDRVLRYIIPLNGHPGSIRSGSSLNQPGTTHASFNCTPPALAEMLVHESTHQYFHMVTRLGPVDDGSDQNYYYSPIKRMDRKIYYILLAYHAFANVVLFCRECLQAGYADEDGYFAKNEVQLMPQLMQLEAALRKTQALTPLGRSLWEPLAGHLR
jgi:HEXXH motif-containing protein